MITASVLIGESITVSVFSQNYPVYYRSFSKDNKVLDKIYTSLKGVSIESITFILPTEDNVKEELSYKIGERFISLVDKEKLDSLSGALGVPDITYMDLKTVVESRLQDRSMVILVNNEVSCTVYLKLNNRIETYIRQGGVQEFVEGLLVTHGKLDIYSLTTLYKEVNSSVYLNAEVDAIVSSRIKFLWDSQEIFLAKQIGVISESFKEEESKVEEIVEIKPVEKIGFIQRFTSFLNKPKKEKSPAKEKVKVKDKVQVGVKSPLSKKIKDKEVSRKSETLIEPLKGVMQGEDSVETKVQMEELTEYKESSLYTKESRIEYAQEDFSEETTARLEQVSNSRSSMYFITCIGICLLSVALTFVLKSSDMGHKDSVYLGDSMKFIEHRNESIQSDEPWLNEVDLTNTYKPSSMKAYYTSNVVLINIEVRSDFETGRIIEDFDKLKLKVSSLEEKLLDSNKKQISFMVSKA